jgi:hypothetical protein
MLIPIGYTDGACDPELSLVASVLWLSVVRCPVRYHLAFAFLLYALCGNPPFLLKSWFTHVVYTKYWLWVGGNYED